MKVCDYISKSIQEYPSLYKDIDYEKSKTKVMDHVFFTIGNGLELGNGYVFDPKYKRSKGEWEVVDPKPYGIEKYPRLPDGFFDQKAYYVYPHPDRVVGRKKLNLYYREGEPKIYEALSNNPYTPYPIMEYSFAYQVCKKEVFIHEDWFAEMKLLCNAALEYYNDPFRYEGCYRNLRDGWDEFKSQQIGFLNEFLVHPGFKW